MELRQLQHEIMDRMTAGASLDDIEGELIARAEGLTEDARSALWLYAWSFQSTAPQRYAADQLLRGLEGGVAGD
jgi:hypothetical protein